MLVHYMLQLSNMVQFQSLYVPRLVSDTTLEDIAPMRRTKRSGSQKNLNNNLTYNSIQQNKDLATTLLLHTPTGIKVFTILEALYIEPL